MIGQLSGPESRATLEKCLKMPLGGQIVQVMDGGYFGHSGQAKNVQASTKKIS